MNEACVNVAYNIVASVIYDVGKWGIGKFHDRKSEINAKEIEEYVINKFENKFDILNDSNIFAEYMKSSVVSDTINYYILYKTTGIFEKKIYAPKNTKKTKEQNIPEKDMIEYLTENLILKYSKEGVLVIPCKSLIEEFFVMLFDIASEFIFKKMSDTDKAFTFTINSRICITENNLLIKMQEIISILNKSTKLEIIDYHKEYVEIKEEYFRILKDNHSKAHIYLLDTFNFCEFYVPPILLSNLELDSGTKYLNFLREKSLLRFRKNITMNDFYEDWKYIFDKNNIVYITGGAGYGKSLFMKKLINDYSNLNIINGNEYLVIYGELKSFYPNNSDDPISMLEFLQLSMGKETLMDKSVLSFQLIEYFLKSGRCIILFDALDEVEKSKRKSLHKKIITFFNNQNPNNKVCITSRNRGFIPEKEIEVFDIAPLDRTQIERYVDKIIKLGKFDSKDKESFLAQTIVLVNKGFLNSFLVLSLLINIFKAERELPENKLDLYQKCFEYIANRREKEKTAGKYDWKLISPMMKDNTFMELSNMCLPNNSDVDKEEIKNMLSKVYKSKYASEVDTESAIDEFLSFCSDRTELFVPSAGEDRFKFFHRSFFEYFYSQYIFLRFQKVEEVYKKLAQFDVDSEIFELTLAIMKQKNEDRYQELIEYIFAKMDEEIKQDISKCHSLNILILGMQVIDDELYKKRLIQYLIDNCDIIVQKNDEIYNQNILTAVCCNDKIYAKQINESYLYYDLFSVLLIFCDHFSEIDKVTKEALETKKNDKNNGNIRYLKYCIHAQYINTFYVHIYVNFTKHNNIFRNLTIEHINEICNKCNAKKKEKEKIKKAYKKYLLMEENQKDIINKLFFEL